MSFHPTNDLAKIKLPNDKFGFSGDTKQEFQMGILVELPKVLNYFGFRSFAFEGSLGADLTELLDAYKEMLDKPVMWTALSQKGSVVVEGEDTFAYVKMTDLLACADSVDDLNNIKPVDDGQFRV